MNWKKLKAKFLVLDGPDGAGKTTQIRLLTEVMAQQQLPVEPLCDPGGTEIGDQIRNILLDRAHHRMSVRCETLLYMASRAQLYHQCIAPALAQGKCVLCDRWLSSTIAYQAVAGQLGPDAVLAIAQAALERIWPDLTVIVDLPAELGLQRLGPHPDRIEQKPLQFHQSVRDAFLALAQSSRQNIVVVDGAGSPADVHQRILEVIAQYLGSVSQSAAK